MHQKFKQKIHKLRDDPNSAFVAKHYDLLELYLLEMFQKGCNSLFTHVLVPELILDRKELEEFLLECCKAQIIQGYADLYCTETGECLDVIKFVDIAELKHPYNDEVCTFCGDLHEVSITHNFFLNKDLFDKPQPVEEIKNDSLAFLQIVQLLTLTHEDDLVSKDDCEYLVKQNLICKVDENYFLITRTGVKFLIERGILK